MRRLWRAGECTTVMGDATVEHTAAHIHVCLPAARQVLSSAVLGGGLIWADHLLNLKVPATASQDGYHQSPGVYLQHYADQRGWRGASVGMMTAASMNSLRVVECREQGVDLAVLVTTGLDNARRAGDRAEHRLIGEATTKVGTINLIAMTSAQLSPAAMVEAQIVMTEAKAAVMQEFVVSSPVSGKIATGTGTDAIAVVNGGGPVRIDYCGKHVLFGELLANCVIEAIAASLEYYSRRIVDGGFSTPAGREVVDA